MQKQEGQRQHTCGVAYHKKNKERNKENKLAECNIKQEENCTKNLVQHKNNYIFSQKL